MGALRSLIEIILGLCLVGGITIIILFGSMFTGALLLFIIIVYVGKEIVAEIFNK